ncbi:MAG: hypothetical protein R3E67_05900 [Pseudomonadales bacterium]
MMLQTVDTLSKGYRRVGLAQAILHDPQVLVLDEPTDGFGPQSKASCARIDTGLSQEKLVIVSTHILEEARQCTRAMIIARGKLLVDETPTALAARSTTGRLDDVFRQLTQEMCDVWFLGGYCARVKSYFSTTTGLCFWLYSWCCVDLPLLSWVVFTKEIKRICLFSFPISRGCIFLVPAISMRLWAEERKSGSIELLLQRASAALVQLCGQNFLRHGCSLPWHWC